MRATNEKFLLCPVCGKRPIVRFYYATKLSLKPDGEAYCNGSLFRRHKKIGVSRALIDPNYLVTLWNKEVKRNTDKTEFLS